MSDVSTIPSLIMNYEDNWAFVSGPVDADLHKAFAYILAQFNNSPVEKPIRIVFTTYGGEVYYALAISDLIGSSKRPVDIVVNGPCMSAGVLILQAARKRYASPGSQFLVHFGSEASDSASEQQHYRYLDKICYQRFHERTGVSIRTIKRWHSGETYFTAEEALKNKIIDKVV